MQCATFVGRGILYKGQGLLVLVLVQLDRRSLGTTRGQEIGLSLYCWSDIVLICPSENAGQYVSGLLIF